MSKGWKPDGDNAFRRVVNEETWSLGLTTRGWVLTTSGPEDYGRVLAGPRFDADLALQVADTEIERVTGVPASIGEEWCFVITLNTGPTSHTRDGTVIPEPGATRHDLIKHVVKTVRENVGLQDGDEAVVTCFYLEPNEVTR